MQELPNVVTIQDITFVSPSTIIIVIIFGILTIILPRHYSTLPLLIASVYITLGQRFVVFSLDFTMMRILILFGWARLFIRKEIILLKLNSIDIILLVWVFSRFITYVLLWKTTGALIYRLGSTFDAVGLYFIFRLGLYDFKTIQFFSKCLAIIIIPLAISMIIEYFAGQNIFAVLGGVPEVSEMRYGRVRCQGSFRHPIMAGTFGATVMPFMILQWNFGTKGKIFAVLGTLASLSIILTAGSSGALLSFGLGIIALMMWYIYRYMRKVRWAIVLGFIMLSIVMKAPIYYIFSKMSALTGGTGWHRSYLIAQAINYFSEWWLIGTTYTAHWMPFVLAINPDQADITNHYISQGVHGGLITMLLFISIIVLCYKKIGQKIKDIDYNFEAENKKINNENISEKLEYFHNLNLHKFTIWIFGCSLTIHVVSFLSVSYFDQIIVIWYSLLAAIASNTIISEEYLT